MLFKTTRTVALLFFCGLANPAQTHAGALSDTANAVVAKIQKATLQDLQVADQIAVAQGDQIAHACWGAWIDFVKREQAVLLDAKGDPIPLPTVHLLTDLQRVRGLLQALQPTSPLSVACAPLANSVKMDVIGLLTKAAGGALVGALALP